MNFFSLDCCFVAPATFVLVTNDAVRAQSIIGSYDAGGQTTSLATGMWAANCVLATYYVDSNPELEDFI